ncbi:tetratricopeptide repeat protein, partial [Streptomyces cinnamoneus]
VTAPVAVPAAAPVTASVAEPVAPPVTAPVAPPVTAPAAAPVAAPVTAPVAVPAAAPVTASVAEPVTASVAAPVAPPVTAPVAPPVTAPAAAPVASPVAVPAAAPVRCPEATDPVVRARTRWFRAYALFNTGDVAASEQLNERALAGFREHGDRWGVAAALALRATHEMIRGDLTALERDGEQSVALFRELGDRWGELQSVGPLATLAEIGGDYARAERLLRDALAIAQELRLATEVSTVLSRMGRIALLTGDGPRARELHERARRGAAEQGFTFGEVHAELGLALGARREGDLAAAEALLLRIRDWYAEVSSECGNPLVLAELGFVAELRGDAVTARAWHEQALDAAGVLGDPRAVALPVEGLAGAAVLSGEPGRAAFLLGAAAAARASAGAPLPPAERGDVDRITAAAEAALGAVALRQAFDQGAAQGPGGLAVRSTPRTPLRTPALPVPAGGR